MKLSRLPEYLREIYPGPRVIGPAGLSRLFQQVDLCAKADLGFAIAPLLPHLHAFQMQGREVVEPGAGVDGLCL